MPVNLPLVFRKLITLVVFGTSIFPQQVTSVAAQDSLNPRQATIHNAIVHPARSDAAETNVLKLPIRKLSAENAVIDKSFASIQSAFHMQNVPLGHLNDGWQSIEKMKACLNHVDASLKAVYSLRTKQNVEYLIRIKGENSGTLMILGHDCSNAVLFGTLGIVIMGNLSQPAGRHGADTAMKTLLPTSRAVGALDDQSGFPLNYKTYIGTLSITEPSADQFTAILKTFSGQVIYQAEYQAFSTP